MSDHAEAANTTTRLAGATVEAYVWNSKPKKRGCNCRGRHHGNPKIGGGICHIGIRPSARERVTNRRLAKRWLDAAHARLVDDVDE